MEEPYELTPNEFDEWRAWKATQQTPLSYEPRIPLNYQLDIRNENDVLVATYPLRDVPVLLSEESYKQVHGPWLVLKRLNEEPVTEGK